MTSTKSSVLMMTSDFLPGIGGAEKQLHRLSMKLIESNWSVTVLTRRHGFEHLKDVLPNEMIDGISVHRLYSNGPSKLASLLYLVNGVVKVARHERNVICHAHGIGAQSWLAVLRSWILNGYSVCKLRGGKEHYAQLLESRIRRTAFHAAIRNFDKLIVVNSAMISFLEEQGVERSRIEYIPNGVDTDAFLPACQDDRAKIRSGLGIEKNAVVFVYVGRLEHIKGVDLLLDAWAEMDAGARANSRLLIVGGGSHESNFRERITSRPELYQGVSMLGEQRAVLKYYKASNHLVLPSRSEGLSNAMVEAMACGLPPVVSNVGGALDLIDDGVNGWFFDVGDPLSLASVLTRANQESSARPQMGIAARQKILNKASIRATAESIESLYEKMTT